MVAAPYKALKVEPVTKARLRSSERLKWVMGSCRLLRWGASTLADSLKLEEDLLQQRSSSPKPPSKIDSGLDTMLDDCLPGITPDDFVHAGHVEARSRPLGSDSQAWLSQQRQQLQFENEYESSSGQPSAKGTASVLELPRSHGYCQMLSQQTGVQQSGQENSVQLSQLSLSLPKPPHILRHRQRSGTQGSRDKSIWEKMMLSNRHLGRVAPEDITSTMPNAKLGNVKAHDSRSIGKQQARVAHDLPPAQSKTQMNKKATKRRNVCEQQAMRATYQKTLQQVISCTTQLEQQSMQQQALRQALQDMHLSCSAMQTIMQQHENNT